MIDFNDKEKTKHLLAEKAEMFKTIAHPVRLCILAMLIKEEKSNVTEIQCCIDVPQPTVSQHLAKLKSAGIVSADRNGTEIIYKIKNQEVRHIVEEILQ
ncbi:MULTISPECIES: helix-turn-helix transcriptional regulator [Sedimentibacter]|jgi:ArsR family transcriptional regulator|uniref:Transcriptional regulator, ArsR family n=1 Tax=Sedimentibacter saalensis TaxID=130788 RepID=A0A562JF60_9FIRM|nr:MULTISPECIES: metalloregulator ArsR/SmtB family transcription factor [Sedimentibacter]MEA5096621.1 metalloregulator ArsR/SmtB family transcription factor [Sedimentibacter saalensis]TWH81808.1 transcriptional regulator, ArsR family [Sedimentibacter saalensis]